nr:Aldo-keto reductase IolS [Paraburkholderia busanensis]
MSVRKLGPFDVNPVGLGCMGMSEFYGPTDEQQSERVLHRALELGVDHFDTADVYGYGHNEELVGRVLNGSGARERVVLATKCGIVRDKDDPAKRGIDNSPAYILEAFSKSAERLKTHIDVFYLHRISHYGEQIEASMSAMATLLKQGAIRAVGLSEASARTIERAHAELLRLTDGEHGLAAVQTEYSLMSRDVEDNGIFAACRDLGVTLVAYSPIGRGLLTDSLNTLDALDQSDYRRTLPRFSKDALASNGDLAAAIGAVAKKIGASTSQIAIAWVLSRAGNLLAIPGTKRLDYLASNVGASALTLSAQTLRELEQALNDRPVSGRRYAPEILATYGLDR